MGDLEVLSSANVGDEDKARAQQSLSERYAGLNQKGFFGKVLGKLITDTNDGVMAYASLKDGMSALRSTGAIYKDETARQEYMALSAEKDRQDQLIKNDGARINEMMDLIDKGGYSDFRSFDFTDMHPMSVAMVLIRCAVSTSIRRSNSLPLLMVLT